MDSLSPAELRRHHKAASIGQVRLRNRALVAKTGYRNARLVGANSCDSPGQGSCIFSAVIVGVNAYATADGAMVHDLFQGDDEGWFEEPALDRLMKVKLQTEAGAIATEGWKWIEVSLDPAYGYSHALRRLSGADDEEAARAKRLAEYRALEEAYAGQDDPEEIDINIG